MPVTTGVVLNASLVGIVDDIRKKSYKYLGQKMVLVPTITPIGIGAKGSSVTEPYFDPTSLSVTTASEGVDFASFSTHKPTTRSYTATESVFATYLTYDNVEDATESYRDEQARAHAYVHAKNVEAKIAACFASFTSSITATTSGMTVEKVAVAKETLANKAQMFDGPFTLAVPAAGELDIFQNLTNVSNVGVLGSLGDKVLSTGSIPVILGDVAVRRTGGITVSATNCTCGLYIKDAIGLWVPRDYKFVTEENATLRAHELVSSMRSGARVRLAAAGVKMTIKSAVA